MKILLLNGPNMNLLGSRQPEIYGKETLFDIEKRLKKTAEEKNVELVCFQTNSEGEMIDFLHTHRNADGLIINAAAYTHSSVALRDAILGIGIKAIEVHLSNIYKRESFRHKSFLSDICEGGIFGLGSKGYDLALDYFCK